MPAAVGVATTSAPPNTVVQIQPGMNAQAVTLVDQNGQYVSMSGRFLCTPAQYAPSTRVTMTTSSGTMAPVTGAASTVAAGSNGGEISQIASWGATYGGNGVLDVATGAVFPAQGGTFTVATSTTTATCTYTAVSGNTLTGCAYVSGSAAGTVSTGGAVTLTSAVASTGSFAAPASGDVVVTASFLIQSGTSGDGYVLGLTAHGTTTPMVCNNVFGSPGTAICVVTGVFIVTGLTPGTAYNFDLLYASPSGATISVFAFGESSTTPAATTGSPVTMTVQAV